MTASRSPSLDAFGMVDGASAAARGAAAAVMEKTPAVGHSAAVAYPQANGSATRTRSSTVSAYGHPWYTPEVAHLREHSSPLTRFLLTRVQHWPLLHSILAEKDSRRIFYFMVQVQLYPPSTLICSSLCPPIRRYHFTRGKTVRELLTLTGNDNSLNFLFMLLQTFYGLATGSLGLLSDSVHMFFDCLALAVGLAAAVMSKWPPSTRFPFGLGKMDTLAGFGNGVFLMYGKHKKENRLEIFTPMPKAFPFCLFYLFPKKKNTRPCCDHRFF